MKTIDLSTLTAAELDELMKNADRIRKEKRESERVALRNDIIALVEGSGLTIQDVFPEFAGAKIRKPRATKAPSSAPKEQEPIRFRNGANTDETWTGRGRMPSWLKRELEAGRSQDDFAV